MAGCAIGTVPLPELDDTQVPHSELPLVIDSSALYYSDSSIAVLLIGVPGAVPGIGTLVAVNQSRGTEDQLPTRSDGGFAGAINARIGDTLELSYIASVGVLAELQYELTPGSVDAHTAGADLGSVFDTPGEPFSPDVRSSDDLIIISGPAGSVPAGIALIAANLSTGAAVDALAASDGSYTVTLVAASGDELVVFAVEPAASHGGGEPILLTAP